MGAGGEGRARIVRGDLIDISAALSADLVRWPGDPPTRLVRVSDLEQGDGCTVSMLETCCHTGTHVDAPLHFLRAGAGVADMPLEATVGRCRVIAVGPVGRITAGEVARLDPRPGERLLFKTANSSRSWEQEPFDAASVCLDPGAASLLAERRVRAVGIDYVSIGPPGPDGDAVHRTLLAAGIWIVEGLCLGSVEPGEYELVCLPLRLTGAEGAPARAFLRPL